MYYIIISMISKTFFFNINSLFFRKITRYLISFISGNKYLLKFLLYTNHKKYNRKI